MSQNIYHDVSQYCDFEDLGDFEDLKDFELLFFLSVLLTIREILERLERDSGDASWSPDQSDQCGNNVTQSQHNSQHRGVNTSNQPRDVDTTWQYQFETKLRQKSCHNST